MLGLWSFYLVRADYGVARELAEETLSHAQRLGDRPSEMEAHLRLGVTNWYIGQPREARTHLERCLALQGSDMDSAHALLYGQDPSSAGRVYLGLVLWYLGYPDQGLKMTQEGLARARALKHPLSLAFAICYSAWLRMERGDLTAFAPLVDELRVLSTEKGFVMWGALGTMFQSVILASQAQADRAFESATEGVSAYRATGAVCGVPLFLVFQASLYSMLGRKEEALALLEEAKQLVGTCGEFSVEPELLRLEGHMILNSVKAPSAPRPELETAQAKAEQCFIRALEAARGRGSKSLELRAATSLAELQRRRGEIARARRELGSVYGWFTEGFETADLLRAKTLLAKLS
jgi:tetratricopeptide (TPR) repeat protein